MAKMQKIVMAIWMVVVAMGMFNSCTKEAFEIESPEQSTSWGGKKSSTTETQKKLFWEEVEKNFTFFVKFEKGDKPFYENSAERPFGAYGEAKKIVEVRAESELSGVKYVEGKLDTQKSEWESGYWHGTESTKTQNFRLANAKYGADFSDTWFSTNAFFQKDTLRAEFADAEWSREVRLDSTDVYNMSVEGGKGYYKVHDFIATVDNTAKVNKDFVKNAAKATKTFTVKDTLSLRFYVEPDPEDQVIDTIGVGTVERRNGKLYGIGRWYARHTLIDPVLVNTQEEEFNASLTGRDGEPVYASNANFETTGEGWKGVGSANYYDNATNGDESFNNTYAISAAKGMTMSYEGIDIVFNANMVVNENGQTIGASTLKEINGQYYNVYPYSNKVNGVYTVSVENQSASIDLYATSSREIRVKVDEVFENTRQVKTVTEKENGFDVKVDFYMKSNLKAEYLAKTLNDEFVFSYAGREHSDLIASSASDFATTSNGVSGNTYRNTLSNKKESTQNIYDWTLNKKETTLSYNGASVTVKCDISFEELEGKVAETAHGTKVVNNVTYDAYAYKNSTRATLACEGKKVTKDASTAYDVLVKHDDTVETKVESQDYSFTANVSGNTMVGTGLNTVKKAEYVNGVKKDGSEQTFTQEKIITATLTVTPTFTVADKAGLNANFTWGSFGETGDEPKKTVEENGKTYEVKARNFRGYVAGKPAYVRLEEKTQVVTIDGVTLATTSVDAVKAVDLVASAVAGNNVTLTPKVNVTLSTDDGVQTKAAVGNPTTYTIEGNMVGTYTPETKVVRVPSIENGKVIVRTYNDVDGDRTLVDEEYHSLYSTLKAQAGSDVYAENYSFTTTYNGKRNVTTTNGVDGNFTYVRENGQVYSTMSNGSVKEDNIADYSFDKTIVYKNGNDTFTFNGSSVLSENTDPITAAGKKGSYDAYAYSTTFNMAYSVDNISIANNVDAVKRNILVINAINIDKGKIKSIDITAVPGHSIGDERFADGSDRQDALKNFAIHTETGVYNVQFVMSEIIPSENQLKNLGTFTSGNYDEYNSACDRGKNGVWVPAKTEDASDALRWRLEDGKARSVRLESLQQWNWRNGDYSTVVTGYTYTVNNGVLTLKYNGNVVLIVK